MQVIRRDSPDYPAILKEIYDPPAVLFVKGNWQCWSNRFWFGVVGARKATEFGKQATQEIVNDLVQRGIGVVSGLAYGIDSCAHKACLEVGGVTWGVLGSGLDVLYPARHAKLAEAMTHQGGYLSEFPLGTPPRAGHFPQRNRIISGLSQAVIVVEATLRSGSLITAQFALEQGREVFVVVPPQKHVAYEGNQKLLDEGATPLVCHCEPEGRSNPVQPTGLLRHPSQEGTPRNDNIVLSLLKKARSLDYLAAKMNKPPSELLSELIQLESQGLIKKIPGPLWQSL